MGYALLRRCIFLLALGGVGISLALTACGNGQRTATRTYRSTEALTTAKVVTQTIPATTKQKPKPAKPRKPVAGGWSNEIVSPYDVSKADVYKQSLQACSFFSVKQVAGEYGSSADPVSAAEAYANRTYQPVFRQPGFEGCLQGFG